MVLLSSTSVVIICSFVMLFIVDINCSKILIYPLNVRSHAMIASQFGDALTEHNQNVDMLLATNNGFRLDTDSKINLVRYPVSANMPFDETKESSSLQLDVCSAEEKSTFEYIFSSMNAYNTFARNFKSECEELLQNTELLARLKRNQYDLIVLDNFEIVCYPTLAYKLDLPLVVLTLPVLSWAYRIPTLPSVQPNPCIFMTDRMTLYERLRNFVPFLAQELYIYFIESTYYVKKYVSERTVKLPSDILRSASMWFYIYDPIAYYPSPRLPNSVDIGDLVMRDSKELPIEYKQLLSRPGQKVVLMSMGTVFNHMPVSIQTKFCDAFRLLSDNITVIWRSNTIQTCSLPSNIIIRSWVPQNDLLGSYLGVDLFITHAGGKSYAEAAYHGVAMIAFPVAMDQIGNAAAMQSKGIGIRMNLMSFKPQELTDNIYAILGKANVTVNVARLSKLLHFDRPHNAKQRIAYWIEHLIEYGGDHLRSAGQDMPLYQFFMLDLLVLAIVISFFGVLVVLIIFRHMRKLLSYYRDLKSFDRKEKQS